MKNEGMKNEGMKNEGMKKYRDTWHEPCQSELKLKNWVEVKRKNNRRILDVN
jgi:hypothetical protein